MREVRRSVIVPYTPRQMYAIVNDVRRYPDFVPWCTGTHVYAESETSIDASVEIARAGVTLGVRTRNAMRPGERIDMQLVDGPLREFAGSWTFVPIYARAPATVDAGDRAAGAGNGAGGEAASPAPAVPDAEGARLRGCRVELDVHFAFRNAALTALFGPLFEASWDSLVGAFTVRARELHGG